ncbi:MAG TPA: diguanylate cyclase [bacterium]|nr:diguanylate cyclase [bacterium]
MIELTPNESTVLVVDDLHLNRKLQRLYLTEVGYRVVLAEDGIDALHKVKDVLPDLILLDVMMPRMNGFEVCRHIKHNVKTRYIPIIMVTALNEIESKIKGIESGADDFICKPFNKLELLARVKSLLRIKYLNKELQLKVRQLEDAQIELKKLAVTDGLTGAYNYRFFKEQLQKEITRAQRHKSHVSIVMIDIDYFKNYNDTHGHPAGDEVLKTISALLKKNIRNLDVAARYGGEEFVLILIESDKNAASIVARKIKDLVENFKFKAEETQPNGKITVSMGVSTYPDDAQSFGQLVELADERLYKAKNAGRNRVVLT